MRLQHSTRRGWAFLAIISSFCLAAVPSVLAQVPPTITQQPQDTIGCTGGSVEFSVVAEGDEPFRYQWRRDGVAIFGADQSTLQIANLIHDYDGDVYDVIVRNDYGQDLSDPATLTLDPAPPIFTTNLPAQPSVCLNHSITLTVAVNQPAGVEYEWYFDGDLMPAVTGPTYTIDSATTADIGFYYVIAQNPCHAATSALAQLSVLTVGAPVFTTNLPSQAEVCDGEALTLTIGVNQTDVTYRWYHDGTLIPGATGPAYTINDADAQDEGAYACRVSNACHEVASNAANLDVLFITPPTFATNPPSSIATCRGEPVTLTVAAAQDDVHYQWYRNGDLIPLAVSRTYHIAALETETAGDYFCRVSNDCHETDSNTAAVNMKVVPTITAQPVAPAAELCLGDPVTLTVAASGTPTLSFRWYKDDVLIEDATTPTLSIDQTVAEDSGAYHAVISNDCGEVPSETVTIAVGVPAVIAVEPATAAIAIGNTHEFSVTTGGTPPFEYHWYKDGVEIPDSNAPAYRAAQAGLYQCYLRNRCGEAYSIEARLSVAAPLKVHARASAYNLLPGASSDLTVTILSGGIVPYTYEWSTGAATESITVKPTKKTTYACTVTDGIGQTGTASVTISVVTDDQSGKPDPNDIDDPNEPNNPTDPNEPNNPTDPNDPNDPNDGGQDQPGAVVCPLTGFGMIGMLVTGLCWTRIRAPRRKR